MKKGNPDLIDVISNPNFYGLTPATSGNHGLWLAEVVSTDDEKKKGRVRVRVIGRDPLTNPDGTPVSDSSLFWALQLFATAGDGYGDFQVPAVGNVGYVLFLFGDRRKPVWTGTLLKAPDGQTHLPTEFQEQYDNPSDVPLIRGFKTPAGHKFIVRDRTDDKEIVIETPSGRRVVIRDDVASSGSGAKQGVEIASGGHSIKLNDEDSTVEVNVTGDCTLNVTGDIKLGGSSLTAILNGVVTKQHPCAFTGAPHPAASGSVMAKG